MVLTVLATNLLLTSPVGFTANRAAPKTQTDLAISELVLNKRDCIIELTITNSGNSTIRFSRNNGVQWKYGNQELKSSRFTNKDIRILSKPGQSIKLRSPFKVNNRMLIKAELIGSKGFGDKVSKNNIVSRSLSCRSTLSRPPVNDIQRNTTFTPITYRSFEEIVMQGSRQEEVQFTPITVMSDGYSRITLKGSRH